MGVQIPSGGPKNKKHPLRCFLFLYTKKKRDLKPTVKKTVRWTVFREERWWYYNWEQAVIYEAESKRIRKSTSGGPKNKKHPLRCFLFLYTKKKKDLSRFCGAEELFWNFLKKFEKSVDIWNLVWYYIWAVNERYKNKTKQNLLWNSENAGVAQLVEQLICNQQVGGSSPSTSSKKSLLFRQ